MVVEVAVLGELMVVVDGIAVTPRSPKERALLALLAIGRGRAVSADRLVDELWPELPPDRGRHALQVRVAEVRKQLARVGASSLLESAPSGYRLDIEPEAVDIGRFEALVEVGRTQAAEGDTIGATTSLRHALGLWHGDAFADVRGSRAVETEAARLEELRLTAVEERIAAELADGSHHRLVAELDALVAAHPLREGLWEQRVLALYRCGRQAEALRACATIRDRLRDELGVEPGPGLTALESAVLAHDPALAWVPTPTARKVVPDPFVVGVGYTGPPPEVRYAKTSDGVHIAYQVVGEGPPDIVIVGGYVSELDNWWEAWSGRLVRRLAGFGRVILFDKRGMGLSDRPPGIELEDWVEDVRAVVDEVRAERPAVVGVSAGCLVAVLYAATHSERTGALVLYGGFARALRDDADESYPATRTSEELEQIIAGMEIEWGTGTALDFWCPSVAGDRELQASFGQLQRRSASPGAATEYFRKVVYSDVRHVLPLIGAPTLVLHAARDIAPPIEVARYTAEHIPGAVLHELDTVDHLIWFSEAIDTITDEIQDFVIGAMPAAETNRSLVTIVAVRADQPQLDLAGELVARYRGRPLADDAGVLVAAFDGATRAVRFAAAAVAGDIASAGVHSGECTAVGAALQGEAVSLASVMAGTARPGQVLVSETVRELVMGSTLRFVDAGVHDTELSLPGRHLYRLERS